MFWTIDIDVAYMYIWNVIINKPFEKFTSNASWYSIKMECPTNFSHVKLFDCWDAALNTVIITQSMEIKCQKLEWKCNRSWVKNVLRLIWSGLNSSTIFDWAFTSVPLEYVISHFKATAAVQNLIRFLCRVAFGLRWRLRVLT